MVRRHRAPCRCVAFAPEGSIASPFRVASPSRMVGTIGDLSLCRELPEVENLRLGVLSGAGREPEDYTHVSDGSAESQGGNL